MKKRTKRLLILAAALLLTGLWIWRVVTLNRFYRELDIREREMYSIGDIVPYERDYIGKDTLEGYSLRVDSVEIRDWESYLSEGNYTLEQERPRPEKLLLVTVTLFNEDNENEEDVFWLTELKCTGEDSVIHLNWDLVKVINPSLEGQYLGLQAAPGSSVQLVLPFGLWRSQLSGVWNHLDRYHMYLRMTEWPTAKIIQLQ